MTGCCGKQGRPCDNATNMVDQDNEGRQSNKQAVAMGVSGTVAIGSAANDWCNQPAAARTQKEKDNQSYL